MMPGADHLQMKPTGDLPECSSSSLAADNDMDNFMPWGWVLENLLDVKKLSLPFFQDLTHRLLAGCAGGNVTGTNTDLIEYVQPHIEQPQCSRLLQKVALRYLDEEAEEQLTASPRKLDFCDIAFLRFLLKEQGVSNLRSRIHSLKESFENDLTLRVETEVVLTNLRCNRKEGRGVDWPAFEDALGSAFPEDMSETRGAERRMELIAVVQDQSNAEPDEHLRKDLMRKFPLEELRRDLANFVDDKRKFFQIKFLDQVAKDCKNGVYSCSPGSDALEPRGGTTVHESTPAPSQNDKHIAIQRNGDSHPCNRLAAGACVSETKDVSPEISLGMAEVEEVRKGFTEDINDIVNHVTTITEDVHYTARMPVLSPDLSNQQQVFAAPIAGNLFSRQEDCVVFCRSKRGEVHLESDEPMEYQRETISSADYLNSESLERHTERDLQQTSRSSSRKDTKRPANETIDQVTAETKKRKLNDVELFKEQRNHRGAIEEPEAFRFNPIMQNTFGTVPSKDRLLNEAMDVTGIMVVENCNMIDRKVGKHGQMNRDEAGLILAEPNLPVDGGDGKLSAKCCFCGCSGGRQAFCHRCSVSIHKLCLLEVCSRQVEGENTWYCFGCAATMARERVRKAQEDSRKAEERLAIFLSARKKRSREPHERQNVDEFSKGTLCGNVIETTDGVKLVDAVQGTTEDSSLVQEAEAKTMSSKSGIITETRAPLPGSTLQNVKEQDTSRQSCRSTQDTEMPTAVQATVRSKGLNGVIGYTGPGQELPREIVRERGPTAVTFSPVSQGLPPGEKHAFGFCGQEQSEGPLSRQIIAERGSTSVLSLPVSPGLPPEDKYDFGCCGQEQLEGPETSRIVQLRSPSVPSLPVSQGLPPGEKRNFENGGQAKSEGLRNSADIKVPLISDVNDSQTKSGPYDTLNADIGATNVATDGAEAPLDRGGHSSPSRDLLFNTRNPGGVGDRHDGDLEEVCQGNAAAGDTISVAEQSVVLSEEKSEAENVQAKQAVVIPGEKSEAAHVRAEQAVVIPNEKSEAANVRAKQAVLIPEEKPEAANGRARQAVAIPDEKSEAANVRAKQAVVIPEEKPEAANGQARQAVAIPEEKPEAANVRARQAVVIPEEKPEAANARTRQAVVIPDEKPDAPNVPAKLGPRKVYRGRGQIPGVRRQSLPWTEIEEDVLKEGVTMFSNGGKWGFQWKRILEFGVGTFHDSRTTVDLKDKWRNMRSKQD